MADYSALIAAAREYAEVAWEKPRELLVALADALEESATNHAAVLDSLDAAVAPVDLCECGGRRDTAHPAGYVVGWRDGDRVEIVLDKSELPDLLPGPDRHAYAELGDALGLLAEVGPEDPDTVYRVYALHELRGDITATASPDRSPAETVTAEFETILNVFLDGFGTGAASALGKVKPDAPGAMIDQAAAALLDRVKVDPIAVEELRAHVRGRLAGAVHNRTTEVRVWPGENQ